MNEIFPVTTTQRRCTRGPLGRRGDCSSPSAQGAMFCRMMLAWEGREAERGQCSVREGAGVVSGSAGPSVARSLLWKGFADGGYPGGTERNCDCPCWSQAVQEQ